MSAPVFIVGCPRSGTSLFRNLLRSHPNLTFPKESSFIPEFYRRFGDPRSEREALDLATRVLASPPIRRWGLEVTPEEFSDCRTFKQLVCRLFEAWARYENKPRWGDKTSTYILEIPILYRLFPEAKFIHLCRDGRDVALSWSQTGSDPANLYCAALKWRTWVTAGVRAAAVLPLGSYLQVKYETLATDLRGTLEKVCDFLDEPFSEQVLKTTPIPDHTSSEERRGSRTPILRANLNKWITAMSADDRILFESVAGDLLAKLEYYTERHTRRISYSEKLMWRWHNGAVEWIRRIDEALAPTLIALHSKWLDLKRRISQNRRSRNLLPGFLQFRRR